MPIFFYKAKLSPDKTTQGYLEAKTGQEVTNKLIEMGYFPISIQETSRFLQPRAGFFKKISSWDIFLFTHQLSGLISSGLVLLKALDTILEQTQNSFLRSILTEIINKIKEGKSFSDALAGYPNVFSNLYISMVKAGELAGNLDEVLKRLEDFSQSEQDLRATIKGAMVYPVFIAVVGFLTVSILIGFVIPKLLVLFDDMSKLPLPTRILIAIPHFLKEYWLFIVSGIFIIIFICLHRFKNPDNRAVIDRLKLRTYFIGMIVQKIEISRFSRTLSVLITSGVDIIPALEIASGGLNNVLIKQEIKKFQSEIKQGRSFTSSIKNSRFFPAFVSSIISVGEETGNLEKALLYISDEYAKEIERIIKALTRLIEPVMILVMGLIVGFIVISMLLPIFQIDLMAK